MSTALFLEYEDVHKRPRIEKLCPLEPREIKELLNAFYSVKEKRVNFGKLLLITACFEILFFSDLALSEEDNSDKINYAAKVEYSNLLEAIAELGEKHKECRKQKETSTSPSPQLIANLAKSVNLENLRLAMLYHSIRNFEKCVIEEEKNVLIQVEKMNSISQYVKEFKMKELESGKIRLDPGFLDTLSQINDLLSSPSISSLKIQAAYNLNIPEKEKTLIETIPGIKSDQFNPIRLMDKAEELAGINGE